MKMNTLSPGEGARQDRKRVGRGIGSGLGKTAGRGHKGSFARSGKGKIKAGFEGGQMPMQRRLPKIGFASLKKKDTAEVLLYQLDKLDAGTIDFAALDDLRLLRGRRHQLGGAQRGEVDGAGVQLVQLVQQHFGRVLLLQPGESDLRQATLHRHLDAFESGLDLALARTRERTLVAAAGGLAQARADAATDALAVLACAIRWLECVQSHVITPRPGPGNGPC